ncbi:MAG: 30S ribosomal protein S12 methylthiotransferase RimO [Bacillota bacterium]
MKKIGIVSLGCSKNTVDTEQMLGYLSDAGYTLVNDPAEAQVLIVNTCGFIASAKEESIDAILEMAQYKKTGTCEVLVATGCLCERYREELIKELPEVDLFLGVREYETLVEKLNALTGVSARCCTGSKRMLTTPRYRAFLRIADGCDNRCTYCAIPLIRGARKSVPMEELIAETERLIADGVRELSVIAQDTSGYGVDLYGRPMLKELLERLDALDGIRWIRVLYTYPNTVTPELIDAIYTSRHILHYLDMPIQHIEDGMLRRMNRHGSREDIERVIAYVRRNAPDFILRSTVIVGFPGETGREFEELKRFLSAHPMDRLGAFGYSAEDGTPAANYVGQVDENVKRSRLDTLMRQQQEISLNLNRRRVGSTVEVLVEGKDGSLMMGRSYAEAPDVDGKVFFVPSAEHEPGEFVQVRLTRATPYDMFGEEV